MPDADFFIEVLDEVVELDEDGSFNGESERSHLCSSVASPIVNGCHYQTNIGQRGIIFV